MPLNQLLKALPDAAILTDPLGVVRGWNPSATQLFGWTADEMVGRPLVERFPEPVRPTVGEHLRQIAAGAAWDGEFEDYHKDGSRLWIEAHIHPVSIAKAQLPESLECRGPFPLSGQRRWSGNGTISTQQTS